VSVVPAAGPGLALTAPRVVASSTRTGREVAAFLQREGGQPWPVDPERADQPCGLDGFLALAGEEIVGCLLGQAVPSLAEGADAMFPVLVVAAGWRRRRVGTRLWEALAAAPRARPTRVVFHVEEPDEGRRAFLGSVGFDVQAEMLAYARDAGAEPPPLPEGPWTFVEYHGGNPAHDAAIVDLHARGYRGSPTIPRLTPEAVAAQAAAPRLAFLLALDGDRVVGFTLVSLADGQAYIDSFVVARSHWGTRVSDALHGRVAALAQAAGCSRITANVERSNHASRRGVERRGMLAVGRIWRFGRELPVSAPGRP
jgi:ribosomal protein S18 acetylase RimI-like enzyme